MTARAILGLVALNAGFAVLGLSLLWALRALPRWSDVLRLAGVGYLVGVAAFGTLWTQLLVVGVPFGGWAIVATLAGGTVAACAAGALLGRTPPEGFGDGRAAPTLDLLTMAAGIALIGLLLEALFRSARLQGLQAYDAWAFWVPKGKAIFFFGGLDERLFTSLPGPTYPPLVPILDAAAFHAMGGVDTVTFHLQYWFILLGAVAAIAGCLHRRVPAWLLWPSLVLVLVLPRFGERLLTPQADVLVDLLFVVGVLLLLAWLADGETWRLVAAAMLLAGATLTKREGLLFAAAALGVALVASLAWRTPGRGRLLLAAARRARRRRPLAPLVPEPFDRRRGADATAASAARSTGWSTRSASRSTCSSTPALWSVAPVVAIVALAAAAVWGDRRVAAYLGALLGIVFVGGAWVTYSFVDIPITAVESVNPIVRYTGAIVLLAVVSTPLLLDSVWRGRGSEP